MSTPLTDVLHMDGMESSERLFMLAMLAASTLAGQHTQVVDTMLSPSTQTLVTTPADHPRAAARITTTGERSCLP